MQHGSSPPTTVCPSGGRAVALVLGSAGDLRRDQLGTYQRAMQQHGDIARFRVGPPRLGFVYDALFSPDAAREVLATNAAHFGKGGSVFAEFEYLFGQGVFTSNGERWRRHRRIVAPLFARRRIAEHLGTIGAAAQDLVAWLDEASAGGAAVDLNVTSMRYALHVLGAAIFGDDVTRVAPVLRESLPIVGAHAARRALAPIRSPHWWPSPANRQFAVHRNRLRAVAGQLVAERMGGGGEATDLLGRLIAAEDPDTGHRLTPDEVRDEALLFLIGGHETTGSALAFTLQLVGRHPDVQQSVRAEVEEVQRTHPDAPLEVDRLPYTARVVQESLRLFPPAHTVVRVASEDTSVRGRHVPEGSLTAISIWGIHHRGDLWHDPEAFRPQRFASAEAGGDPGAGDRYAHLPFGGGPRSCVGEHLAFTELVVALASIVRRFDVEALLPRPETEVDLTLRPHGPVPAQLRPVHP